MIRIDDLELLTRREVAQMLGVSRTTVERYLKKGKFASVGVKLVRHALYYNGCVLFEKQSVLDYIASLGIRKVSEA